MTATQPAHTYAGNLQFSVGIRTFSESKELPGNSNIKAFERKNLLNQSIYLVTFTVNSNIPCTLSSARLPTQF